MSALFASVGLASTGYIASITVTPLVAEDMLGTAAWSGVPVAAGIVGTAAGTALLSWLMARRGRRFGLITGYIMGSVAAGGALAASGRIRHVDTRPRMWHRLGAITRVSGYAV